MGDRPTVLHFAEDDDTSGFFPQLAKWHDRSRYAMVFATLRPMAAWLREHMEASEVECFSAEASSRSAYPAASLRLWRYLGRRRPDVLHAHLFDPAVVGLPTAAAAGVQARVLTRHHSDYHTRIDRPAHVALDRMCTRLAHRVIAVSHHTRAHLVDVERSPAEKVVAIPNGVDFERIDSRLSKSREDVRRELGAGTSPVLLIPARLHPEKGHGHLFGALKQLLTEIDPPPLLVVAGTGPLRPSYEDAVREMGIDHVVRFLGFRQDLPDLMRAADVVVLPSVAEAFGLAAVEALYIGTPVVASRAGALPEIVADGVDGLLVPPADPTALARAISRVLLDHGLRQRLAGAGRARVSVQYRFDTMMRAYEDVYAELLGRA